MIDITRILISFLFSILYGIMENRLFYEGPLTLDFQKYYLLGHFKLYHLCMFFLFMMVAFQTNVIAWLWTVSWMPFIQDATWQIFSRRKLTREDWSNFGGFPLVFGLYAWYWIEIFNILIGCVVLQL